MYWQSEGPAGVICGVLGGLNAIRIFPCIATLPNYGLAPLSTRRTLVGYHVIGRSAGATAANTYIGRAFEGPPLDIRQGVH